MANYTVNNEYRGDIHVGNVIENLRNSGFLEIVKQGINVPGIGFVKYSPVNDKDNSVYSVYLCAAKRESEECLILTNGECEKLFDYLMKVREEKQSIQC
ncbi:MAG: hypothetical protein HZB65_04320 [Candidatus Aenigmarchaeota archaeon]|nr:hypothetical protein [Candidatus Aenigmarchaeota archaeon]